MIRVLSVFTLLFSFSLSHAAERVESSNPLEITNARIITPMKGGKVTAGFGEFKNTSQKPLTLKVTGAKGFKAVELHESLKKDGKMSMKKRDQVRIEPLKTLTLKPGSYHLMLFEADPAVVKEGEMIPVEFSLNGVKRVVEFKVSPRGEHHHHHAHDE